ncbi:MAG: SGNH/GDSL hydrolase family protein [Candidatus Nanopelagicales bacterium]
MSGRHLLVLGDSLTFHGPERPEVPTDPRLYPNVAAAALGEDVAVDLLARAGWTARDAWWALTRDPVAWGVYLPRASAVVLSVGHMDALPAAIPGWARDSIAYLRPGSVRRRARVAYGRWGPPVIRATRGRMRQLPQRATDHYLARLVAGVRHWRPDAPVVLLGPSPHDAALYPSQRHHEAAVAAARLWAATHDVAFLDIDPLVRPSLVDGTANPDGMHWSWTAHRRVGEALGASLAAELGGTT